MALALSTIVIAVLAILLGFLLIPTDDKIEDSFLFSDESLEDIKNNNGEENTKTPPEDSSGANT